MTDMAYSGKKETSSDVVVIDVTTSQLSSSSTNGSTGNNNVDLEKKAGDSTNNKNQIDPGVEKRLLRKLDWQVTGLLAVLYMLSFLDRSNIGNARIAGMAKDLDLKGQDYDWLLTIFYISYILFSFQGFMWRVVKPHQWAAFIVCAWGIISTCQAAAQSWSGMMVLRFLLGAAEAGYSPSVAFLLSFFYNRKEIGFRIGIWGCAAPLASTFAGALAYAITSGHSEKIASWRLLFLVEGLPTIIAAGVAFFVLPDSQSQARFLTDEEREVARLRTAKQFGRAEVDREKGGYHFREVGDTLLDPVAWFNCIMYFCVNVSFAAIPVFLPTIISEMGPFSPVTSQGISAPPYFLCIFTVLLTTWFADRTQQRGLTIFVLSLIGASGYIILATCRSVAARYAGIVLAINGGFAAIASILPWVVNNQGSVTRRGMGVVVMNLAGQCGPLLGTRLFPLSQKPRYVKGQSVCAAFLVLNALVALAARTYMGWKNRKWDREEEEEQKGDQKEKVESGQDVKHDDNDNDNSDDGEENFGRKFRYCL